MAPPPQEEPPLRAIVFADACGGRPSPSPSAPPAHALPLHCVPLLHYQLYALATSGAADALVLSSAPLSLPPAVHAMPVTALSSPEWRSHGDALRDVEARVALRPAADFLLVQPGSLFNLRALDLARAHAARAAADRNWLVSLLFRRAAAAAPLAVAAHARSGALCMYARGGGAAAGVALDARAENVGLRGGGAVRVCADVVDVGLDVCSPDLLVEFRENFDFHEVRDYVRAKLEGGEAELLGNRMHARFVDTAAGEFATCVDGLAAYARATRDVRDGWLLPIVPARVARAAGTPTAAIGDGAVTCVGAPAEVDPTASLADCTLGAGVVVEAGAVVRASVLGDGSVVAAGAVVDGCVLGSRVVVRRAAKLLGSVLLDDVAVASEVSIPKGCFLDRGVVIGPGGGAVGGMQRGSWVAKVSAKRAGGGAAPGAEEGWSDTESDESDDSDSAGVDAGAVVCPEWLGDGGVGKVLPERRRCHLYLEQSVSRADEVAAGWPAFFDKCSSDSEDELEEEAADDMDSGSDGERGCEVDEDAEERRKMERFYSDMEETVEHGVSEAADVDTIALEVNSLKLGYELMYSHARIGVVRALAAIVRKECALALPKAKFTSVRAIFKKWAALVAKFSSGDNAQTQRNLVDNLAGFLVGDGLILQYVLRTLYDQDVLEEEPILAWATAERAAIAAGGNGGLFAEVSPFIEWLEEADEED